VIVDGVYYPIDALDVAVMCISFQICDVEYRRQRYGYPERKTFPILLSYSL